MTASLMSRLSEGCLLHIRGNGARNALEALSLQAPDVFFQYSAAGESGFIATLGASEFLVYFDQAGEQASLLETSSEPQAYVFPRDDRILSLADTDWQQVLRYVCGFDFSKSQAGEFVLANMAGVSTWFRIPDQGAPLVFGCDPSFGHYLQHTMQEVLQDHAENIK